MKGKLLLMENNKQYQEAWDFMEIIRRTEADTQRMNQVLDMGFEPYAVIHWPEMSVPTGVIQAGKPNAPTIVEKHFFKRRTRIEVVPEPKKS